MQVGNLSPNGSSVLSSYINGYSSKINNSLEKLASGLRVTRPSEGASEYFKAQSLERRANEVNTIERGLQTHLSRNQTAEGYLDTVSSLLNDMSDLAQEASSETDNTLRTSLGKEYDVKFLALKTFVDSAKYEGESLLTGSYDSSIGGTAFSIQLDEGFSDLYSYDILDTRLDSNDGLNLASYGSAETDWAISQAESQDYYDALNTRDSGLTRLKRNSNRIDTHIGIIQGATNSLAIKSQNYQAAASALVGVNDAEETTRLSTLQIRQQAAASFLAQNNFVRASVYSTLSQAPGR